MKPEETIALLTQRIYRLEQEMSELRQVQGLPPHKAVRPKPQPPVAPPVVAAVRPVKTEITDEANIVGTWFARVGMIAILIGAGFAFKYAVDRGIIGPTARVIVGLIAAGAFVAWGEIVFRRGWTLFAQAVTGGGIALAYLSILSGQHTYDLFGSGVAFVLLLAVTVGAGALALRQDAIALAVVALVGGFMNPFLVGADRLDPVAFLSYVAALDVLVLLLAPKKWAALTRVALIGSSSVVLAVHWNEWFAQRIGFATIIFAIFAAVPFVQELLARLMSDGIRSWFEGSPDREGSAIEPDVVIGSVALYYGYVMWVLNDRHAGWRGLFTIVIAAAYAGGAAAAKRMRLSVDPGLLVGVALVLATMFVPIQLNGGQIGAAWVAEGVVLYVLNSRFIHNARFRLASDVLFVLGAVAVLASFPEAYPPSRLFANMTTVYVLAVVAGLAAASALIKADGEHDVPSVGWELWAVAANVVTLAWLSCELVAQIERSIVDVTQPVDAGQPVAFGLTALWGVYGATLVTIGVAARQRWARLSGVGLLAITVGKLAFADLWQLRTPYRIAAFMGLGAILLVCSVMYQRFRDLILAEDDEPEPVKPAPAVTAPKPAPKRPPAKKSAPKSSTRKTARTTR